MELQLSGSLKGVFTACNITFRVISFLKIITNDHNYFSVLSKQRVPLLGLHLEGASSILRFYVLLKAGLIYRSEERRVRKK